MLEFDDIQHILLTRTPAMTGRYEFLSFDDPAGGRAWLAELIDRVESAATARASMDSTKRWITLAFTWNGLRALGVAEESLATFPEEFRAGHGRSGRHPRRYRGQPPGQLGWRSGQALTCTRSRSCSRATTPNTRGPRRNTTSWWPGAPVCGVLSLLDLNATPPFDYAHDHFGFRDRLSQPVIEGSGEEPTPGSGAPLKPGEFILGYPDEDGAAANLPQPEVLSRNGSYMAYRRLQEHVGLFRDYLREHADTPDEQELLAAKFMGRWRSGAPLVLAPDKDDPELGADPMRNNDFNYKEMDPHGYAVPAGIARATPQPARHRAQHEPAQDDPPRCYLRCCACPRARPTTVWIAASPHSSSAPAWFGSSSSRRTCGSTTAPSTSSATSTTRSCGTQDGTLEFTIPKRPIRKTLKGLPAFTTLKGGAYFFLPGINALRYLAALD